MDIPEEIESSIRSALNPTRTEITRSKKRILEELAHGQAVRTGLLQSLVTDQRQLTRPQTGEKLTYSSPDSYSAEELRSLPMIEYYRLGRAAGEAIVELVAQGVIVEVGHAPGPSHPFVRGDVHIGVQYRNLGSGVTTNTGLPDFAEGYRLLPLLADSQMPWFLASDLFLENLEEIIPSEPTRRCIEEALSAYRRGLYLASVNLLGTASEGAWFSAAEQLREKDHRLQRSLERGDGTLLQIVKRVVEILNQTTSNRSATPGLQATAELLRLLRNYGVHPRQVDPAMERYLAEPTCGVLILDFHSYLATLGRAVEARLAGETDD